MAGKPQAAGPWAYTRAQRLGLLALLILLGLCTLANRYVRRPVYAIPEGERARLLAAATELRAGMNAPDATKRPGRQRLPESFPFDPNTVTEAELQRLGLSAKQAASWIKYRQRGGFRRVEDIAKLYVLRPEQVEHLLPLATVAGADRVAAAGSGDYAAPAPPPPRERFVFDPNTVSADSLRRLGFSEREANSLIKYRSYRPVTFRRAEDLRRVNALDPELVDELIELIEIDAAAAPTAAAGTTDAAPAPRRPPPVAIDANRATVADWQQLPGIGQYRAERIVKFRDLLGGFVSVEQVGTTYGLPDSTFRRIAPYLTVGSPLRTLDLNRADAETLARHPYLKLRTARVIVRYRDNHGPYGKPEDLKKIVALSEENRLQLLPYLNFD